MDGAENGIDADLLEGFEVPVDDLLVVEVLHARGNLASAAHHLGGQDLHLGADVVVQGAPRAVLQDDAEAGWFGAHASVERRIGGITAYNGVLWVASHNYGK